MCQAIDFVRSQRDEELWDYLITWALGSSETTGVERIVIYSVSVKWGNVSPSLHASHSLSLDPADLPPQAP